MLFLGWVDPFLKGWLCGLWKFMWQHSQNYVSETLINRIAQKLFALGNTKLYFPISIAKPGPVFQFKQNEVLVFFWGCHVGRVHRQQDKEEEEEAGEEVGKIW